MLLVLFFLLLLRLLQDNGSLRTDGRMDGRIRNSTDVFDDFAAALRGLAIYDMATVCSY